MPEEVTIKKVGDFYEVYDEHAKALHSVLELTLAKRGKRPCIGWGYWMHEGITEQIRQAGYTIKKED